MFALIGMSILLLPIGCVGIVGASRLIERQGILSFFFAGIAFPFYIFTIIDLMRIIKEQMCTVINSDLPSTMITNLNPKYYIPFIVCFLISVITGYLYSVIKNYSNLDHDNHIPEILYNWKLTYDIYGQRAEIYGKEQETPEAAKTQCEQFLKEKKENNILYPNYKIEMIKVTPQGVLIKE